MSATDLTVDQVLTLFRQLPSDKKLMALKALSEDAARHREENLAYGEMQLRKRANERGLDWDKLNDDEREEFIDRLLHE